MADQSLYIFYFLGGGEWGGLCEYFKAASQN